MAFVVVGQDGGPVSVGVPSPPAEPAAVPVPPDPAAPAPPEPSDPPVSAPAPDVPDADDSEDESDSPEPDDAASSGHAPKPRQRRSERRIRQLISITNDLRHENAALRARLEAPTAPATSQPASQAPLSPQAPASALVEPRQQEYDTPEAFGEALRAYWRAMAREEAKAEWNEREAQSQAARQAELQTRWQARVEDAQALAEDFDVNIRLLPRYVPQDLFGVIEEVVIQDEDGGAFLAHLVRNPALMQELARYRPGKPALEFLQAKAKQVQAQRVGGARGREAQRTQALPGATAVATIPDTTALPPVTPLHGNGFVPTTGYETARQVAARGGTIAEYERAKARDNERR